MNCVRCGDPITDHRNAWHQVIGYERARNQGGTNHVALRGPTGKMMCNGCMTVERAGIAPGQQALTSPEGADPSKPSDA